MKKQEKKLLMIIYLQNHGITPYAVKCVLHIIEKENISNLFVGTEPLVLYLLKFICLCRDGAESDDKLKKSILDGKPTYYECLDHPNSKVSKVAGKLIRFCYLEWNIADFQ